MVPGSKRKSLATSMTTTADEGIDIT